MADSSKRKISLESEGRISPPLVKRKTVVKSTTTQTVVANFFKPTPQKEPEPVTYKVVDKTLLVVRYGDVNKVHEAREGEKKPRKIAAFDLDSTLIKTKSGNVHAKDERDWQFWCKSVPTRLKELHSEGYDIIIFTNQGGMSLSGKTEKRTTNFKNKVKAVLKTLDVPTTAYCATEKDMFRKPRSGMWKEMVDDYDIDIHGINTEDSFLVGDAAGRKGDHSAVDRHFANNAGIKFYTPEEYFLGQPPQPFVNGFEPGKYLDELVIPGSESKDPPSRFSRLEPDCLELVIFVGSPGAGKSSFYRTHLEPLGYERVNQDTLKSRDKCIKVASEHLKEGRSVAVDNTNPDLEVRKLWLKLGAKFSAKVRCVYFTASPELCEHNDAVRGFGGELMNPEKRECLPKIAFTGFKGRFVEPKVDEGFTDLIKVDFMFEGSEEQKAIWRRYWI